MNNPVALSDTEYLANRVDDQISWYDRKSGILKRRYRWMKATTIICSALIPVLIGFSDQPWGDSLKYVAAGLGVIVTIVEGMSGMLKDKETMLAYRSTREALVREKMLYVTQSLPAAEPGQAFRQFVQNCETIMGSENSQWASLFRDRDQNGSGSDGTPS
jgi:hypothetical protein